MTASVSRTALLTVGAVAVLNACSDPGPRAVPVAASGALVVDFTIDGTKDADQCAQGSVSSIDVTVETVDGEPVGEFEGPCTALATSIDLAPGGYTATAVLIDSSGADRTTPVSIDPFSIHGEDELHIPIDFPARSFL
jgi:hypothetical protein